MKTSNLMTKVYELRYKSNDELIISSIEENAVRKEYIKMKQDGENMEDVYGCENFMPVKEWNEAMISASK